jgi:hypothetical protein
MTRDEVEVLEQALRETPLPDEVAARERARRTVLAAHSEVVAPRRRARPLVWVAVAAACAAVVVAQRDGGLARAFEGFVRDVVDRREAAPRPAPAPVGALALPADGRVLVTEDGRLYVVERSGRRRELGRARTATWSPNGLFVAAAAGRTLAALDPADGSARWRLRLRATVSLPRWSPDGRHVAYKSGDTLRIVYGNGIHDVQAGRRMAAVAPAWRPGAQPVVAWASTTGTVTVEHADTGKPLWRRHGGEVRRLAWSADGRRLLIAGRRNGSLHDLTARTREPVRLPRGAELAGAAFSPGATRLALAVYADGQTKIRVQGELLLTAPGKLRDLEWSPDGRWILAGWPAADHWLLVRASDGARISAVNAVRHRFGEGARVHGWAR